MACHKHFDRIVAWAVAAAIVIALAFLSAGALGLSGAARSVGYEKRLFDDSCVHTIDIQMDDWDGFLDHCTDEEYTACTLTIDGERHTNVAIRAKGNTSMSSVAQYRNNRYSFKVEFDHYDDSASYHGLDKLNLNNGIFDNSYMKDYLVYHMMNDFGAAAPLSSFAWVTVNGEPWGLYLAIEGVEDGFLRRNYGSADGDLYKPDGLGFGGNDASGEMTGGIFDMDTIERALAQVFQSKDTEASAEPAANFPAPEMPGAPDTSESDANAAPAAPAPDASGEADGDQSNATSSEAPENSAPSDDRGSTEPSFDFPAPGGGPDGGPGGFGMGDNDVKLRYIDDDPDSYPNIFSSAKTTVTDEDKARLIASLKNLTNYENLDEALDMDAVLRYLVVHIFVCNGDSYTGGLVHNYYLYEQDGHLSMIPWDYNLAFGTFQGADAQGEVNDPIDSPGDTDGSGSRPMADWLFSSEEYTALYHAYFAEFIDEWFTSGKLNDFLDETMALIAPYVAVDPTAFCTLEEFGVGVSTLRQFCLLRAESVSGQLAGTIPTTDAGQLADSSALIDASALNLSAMGKMGGGGPSPNDGSNEPPQPPTSDEPSANDTPPDDAAQSFPSSAEPEQPASAEPTPTPAPAPSGEAPPAPAENDEPSADTSDRPSGEMPQPPSGEMAQQGDASALWLLAGSLALLILGLIFARRFPRRR